MAHISTIYPIGNSYPSCNTNALRHKNDPKPYQANGSHPPPGLHYKEGTLVTPSPDVRDTIIGFTPGTRLPKD